MGLDWEPLPMPKPGQEREFLDLFHKLESARGARRDRLLQWFAEVAVPAYQTLGAPRVGYDKDADDWLYMRAEKSFRLTELDEIRKDMHGYYVLALLPPCDGFPVYSNHMASEHLERYAFHAELLVTPPLREALGEELVVRAHRAMLPDALAKLGAEIGEVARGYQKEHGLGAHVATVREPVFAEGTTARNGHVLFAAAKWCAYWAERGHGAMPT